MPKLHFSVFFQCFISVVIARRYSSIPSRDPMVLPLQSTGGKGRGERKTRFNYSPGLKKRCTEKRRNELTGLVGSKGISTAYWHRMISQRMRGIMYSIYQLLKHHDGVLLPQFHSSSKRICRALRWYAIYYDRQLLKRCCLPRK